MPDREKVIGLLQEIAEYFRECRSNASFASKAENHFWELQNAANEAVALLKEQEAVEPEVYYVGQDKYKFYRCPVCKIDWYYKGNYCLSCGRSVKWG